MKRVAWLTDLHLNFVSDDDVDDFLDRVRDADPEAVLISGDIAESRDVTKYLVRIDDALRRPIYFVLGNHDFYFGAIHSVRRQVGQLCRERPNLFYLNDCGPIALHASVGLVGHDGWADGREGDYERSFVMMNDYKLIAELAGVGKRERLPLLHALGDEAAESIREKLPAALERFPQVILVTHVPPLRGACWHDGHLSDDEWAPHFTCQAMGEAILDVMRAWPDRQLVVLCGHTHGHGECRPLDNVLIHTGRAQYGQPGITRMLVLDALWSEPTKNSDD